MLDTLRKLSHIIVISNTESVNFFTNVKKSHKKNSKDYEFCIKLALDNAKIRINLLNNSDRKCVL